MVKTKPEEKKETTVKSQTEKPIAKKEKVDPTTTTKEAPK